MKDLFICSAGKRRSPRAASKAKELALKSGIENYKADYSRIDSIAKNPSVLNNYNRVFVMDDLIMWEFSNIANIFKGEVIILGVDDVDASKFYTIGESKLMKALETEIEEKLKLYFRRK